jgi:hypothetical protein
MGVIDNEFKRLQDVVTSLEERVKRLEHRQSGEPLTAEGVRMILIGPPGAGMYSNRACGAAPRQASGEPRSCDILAVELAFR